MKTENLTTDVKMSELSLEAMILELNRRMDADQEIVGILERELQVEIFRDEIDDFSEGSDSEDWRDPIDYDGEEYLVIGLESLDEQLKADLIRENFDKFSSDQLRKIFEGA